jgi:hypothetical protein
MPRFFFDLLDASGVHRDEVGLELTDLDAAKAEARRALLDISRDDLRVDGDGRGRLELLIRDDGIGPVRLSITLTEE